MNYKAIKTLKAQVEHCLTTYPETRNSDITLMLKIWQLFYPELVTATDVPFNSLYQLPREDNVKRVRAAFNSKGLFYPTSWEVAKARDINRDEWQVAMGYPTQEKTYTPHLEAQKPHTFNSTSDSEVQYQVVQVGDGLSCNCPGFYYKGTCKHLRTVLAEMQHQHQPKIV